MSGEVQVRPFIVSVDLPPAELSPNRKAAHFMALHRARKAYRRACELLILVGKSQGGFRPDLPFKKAALRIVFYTHRFAVHGVRVEGVYRPRDVDNALSSVKPAIDALVSQGIVASDSAECLSIESVTIIRKSEIPMPCVILDVREVLD